MRKTDTTTYDEAGRVTWAGDGVNDLIGDHGQRWVGKTLDTNANRTIENSRILMHDAGQIVLDFTKIGTGDAAGSAETNTSEN